MSALRRNLPNNENGCINNNTPSQIVSLPIQLLLLKQMTCRELKRTFPFCFAYYDRNTILQNTICQEATYYHHSLLSTFLWSASESWDKKKKCRTIYSLHMFDLSGKCVYDHFSFCCILKGRTWKLFYLWLFFLSPSDELFEKWIMANT